MAADSLETTLKLRQNEPIHKPSDREEECHRRLLTLVIKMGDMMKLQAELVRIDTANEKLQEHAHYVTKQLERWADAVSTPDCSLYKPYCPQNRRPNKYNWEPAHLIQNYHTTTSSPKAIALVERYSPGNNLLLLPSTGGWEAAMGVIKVEKILEGYPSMLEKPWCKAVALHRCLAQNTGTTKKG